MTIGNEVLLVTAVLGGLVVLFVWLARRRRRRLLGTVGVEVVEGVYSEFLENTRSLFVFLPPGYEEQGGRRYPVLYLNDGQDRERLKVRETLARLFERGLIEPVIVAAIPTTGERLQEYGTAVAANAQGLGTKAGLYGRFVTEEMMPLVNERYRTKRGAADTAIAGMSLGGLSAFDIAWNHPDLFGMVGVFSGSFWWRAAEDETNVRPGELIVHQVVRGSERKPRLRIWLEAATRDEVSDRDENGVIDAIQDTVELIEALAAVGYAAGEDVVYVEVVGGRHDYGTWARVFPVFLRWGFGA